MKILGFTSTRSDYDLMTPLYFLLQKYKTVDFKLLVSGTHLSSRHGDTVALIKKDGFSILGEIKTLFENKDSASSQLQSAHLLFEKSIELIDKERPDLMIYVGDREDVIIYAMIAGFLGIPTVHFWGGDHAQDGNIDNVVRHATSKFSTFHFVALEQHKERLIKIGENKERIFCIGNMALDAFQQPPTLSKKDLFKKIGAPSCFEHYAILIFHPLPSEKERYGEILQTMIQCLLASGLCLLISAPNADPGHLAGFEVIERYKKHPQCFYYKNLDRSSFITLYRHAAFIIGNSSSGIIEAASIPLAAINVGERQKNRYCEDNVVFCSCESTDILDSIETVLTPQFQQRLKHLKNPYGDGHSAKKAYELICQLPLTTFLSKHEDPLQME